MVLQSSFLCIVSLFIYLSIFINKQLQDFKDITTGKENIGVKEAEHSLGLAYLGGHGIRCLFSNLFLFLTSKRSGKRRDQGCLLF